MADVGSGERDAREDLLLAVGLCLLAAVVLVFVAGLFFSYSAFSGIGVSTRDHLELFSRRSSGFGNAALLLGAVLAFAALPAPRRIRVRPLFVLSFVAGAAIVLLSAFTIVDVLTRHVSQPGDDVSIGLIRNSFGARMSAALPAAASVTIAIVAVVAANRFGNIDRGPRDRRLEDDVPLQDLSDGD